jgi:hypothetical protein
MGSQRPKRSAQASPAVGSSGHRLALLDRAGPADELAVLRVGRLLCDLDLPAVAVRKQRQTLADQVAPRVAVEDLRSVN